MILSDGSTHLREDGVRVWGRTRAGMAVEQTVPNGDEKCAKRDGFMTETANMRRIPAIFDVPRVRADNSVRCHRKFCHR